MFKSKPILILKTLSNKELKKFIHFLSSPYFNVNLNVQKLYKILYPLHPEYKAEHLKREKIFRKLFPKIPYQEQKLRYVMSDLTKALEEFLIFQQLLTQESYANFLLLKAYGEKNLDKYFNQSFQHAKTRLEKKGIRDDNYYLMNFKVEEENLLFQSKRKNHAKIDVNNTLYNLDTFFMAKKLKYCCEINNTQNILLANYTQPLLLEEILHYLQNKLQGEQPPVIAIYYQILMSLLDSDDESHYNKLLEYLDKYVDKFTQHEVHNLYIYARNYCIDRLNNGDVTYLRKLYAIYKLTFDKKIILDNEQLSQWDYKNMVSISIRLGEFDYAKHIIYNYKVYLRKETRENAFLFNLGHYHFAQKDYDMTLELLAKVIFTDPYYHTDTKILLIKCYYELSEMMPLFNLIDTFKAYLNKNKQTSTRNRTVYLTFLKYVKKLMRIKMGNRKSISALKAEIKAAPILGGNLAWLYEKAQELEDSNK